ncbi:hypothetical protein [Pseudomonas sp. NPDC089534]|uniref:hypothetical protein n=1 Tax=Pseudomonas sp. NPDC089534 TaxID=3364468 RepID=UPI0037F16386
MKTIAGVILAAAALVGSGSVLLASSEFPDCNEAWYQNTAYKSCKSISQSNYGGVAVPQSENDGFRTCKIRVWCEKSDGQLSDQRLQLDVTQVPQLSNCNGVLKVGQC